MVGPGSCVVVAAADLEIPSEWGLLGREEAVQMVSNTQLLNYWTARYMHSGSARLS
jgi:hypothetical protein